MRSAEPPPPGGDVVGAAVPWLAGLGAAVGALVWAGAQLAALVSGRGPLRAGVDDVARALVGLPRHASDPRDAWPPALAERLPPPALYWAAQGVVVAAVALAATAAVRRWRRSARGHPLRVRAEAGLARGGELRQLAVRGAEAGRLSLGRGGSRLLAAEPGASLAVVGPTGCGKTAGFAIPAILEWRGPLLATSVKADLLAATLAHRRRRGEVWIYDPSAASGERQLASWSPLAGAKSWAGAMRIAAWLAEAAQPRRDSVTDGDYWYTQARRGLGPYLLAAAVGKRGMAEVVRWVDAQDEDEIEAILGPRVPAGAKLPPARPGKGTPAQADGTRRRPVLGADHALVVARGLWNREERLRGSVFSTMENIVAPYADPGVGTARRHHVELARWLSGDNTIYVVATAHEQARLRPVLTVLVQQAVRAAYDHASSREKGMLPQPCLVLLDEAANIAPLPDLPGYAATGRSHGITLVTVWQDLAQVEALYGGRAQSLLNNHRAKLFGSGIADLATLDYVSQLIGEQRRVDRQRSIDLAGGRRSVTESGSYRRVAPVDLIRRVRPGEAVLVYGAELPALLRLRPWYRDRHLDALAGVGP